jgi:hypothetical protein
MSEQFGFLLPEHGPGRTVKGTFDEPSYDFSSLKPMV